MQYHISIKLNIKYKNGQKKQQEKTKAFLKDDGWLLNFLKATISPQNGNDDGIVWKAHENATINLGGIIKQRSSKIIRGSGGGRLKCNSQTQSRRKL